MSKETVASKEIYELREKLAAYAHDAWAGWMKYLFERSTLNDDGSVTIPPKLVERWKYQMETSYADLPWIMKPSDREEADKMIQIVLDSNGTTRLLELLERLPAGANISKEIEEWEVFSAHAGIGPTLLEALEDWAGGE